MDEVIPTGDDRSSDWIANVEAALAARYAKKGRKGPAVHPGAFRRHLSPLSFAVSSEFMRLLDGAAVARDVNRASFARRAIALQVAHVLGMPIHQVLYETPCPGRWGRIQNAPGERDLGEGIENWCPHPGCTGDHLRLP